MVAVTLVAAASWAAVQPVAAVYDRRSLLRKIDPQTTFSHRSHLSHKSYGFRPDDEALKMA